MRIVDSDDFFRGGINTTMRVVAIGYNPGDDNIETATLTMNPILDDVV